MVYGKKSVPHRLDNQILGYVVRSSALGEYSDFRLFYLLASL